MDTGDLESASRESARVRVTHLPAFRTGWPAACLGQMPLLEMGLGKEQREAQFHVEFLPFLCLGNVHTQLVHQLCGT